MEFVGHVLEIFFSWILWILALGFIAAGTIALISGGPLGWIVAIVIGVLIAATAVALRGK